MWKYELGTVADLADNTSTKGKWKTRVLKAVHSYWSDQIDSLTPLYSTLIFLRQDKYVPEALTGGKRMLDSLLAGATPGAAEQASSVSSLPLYPQSPVEEVVNSDSDDSDIAESGTCIMCKLFYPPCTDTKLSFINIVKWGFGTSNLCEDNSLTTQSDVNPGIKSEPIQL
ncbi:hypothetical protein DPMN_016929 [Dreissena polymorpha]|uniref:Uncharacterized protein n=1 Tax=Dreissena polymorpha TaxID=45954 RepID=A0A9D4S4Z6_DREPO|nr:hypothetical protein DPMN_016929 [Dreissena polymorpha]